MIRGQVNPQEGRIIGIKGIYDLFGQAVNRDVQSREPVASTPSAPVSSSSPTPTFFTLQLIGALTISLGVLNLLPIPLLDGGHLMYYTVEIFKGSPVSDRMMEIGQKLGLTLLLVLMAFAFYNDINRLISG